MAGRMGRTVFNALFILSLSHLGSRCFADDVTKATGLLPPTTYQKNQMDKQWWTVTGARLTSIGLNRVNLYAQQMGLPLLKLPGAKVGDDIIGLIEGSNSSEEIPFSTSTKFTLPASVNNTSFCPQVQDQGKLNAGVAFATTLQTACEFSISNNMPPVTLSQSFVYNMINDGGNNPTHLFDTYTFLQFHGDVPSATMPYSESDPVTWDVDAADWESAVSNRLAEVFIVRNVSSSPSALVSIKMLLTNGHVATVGTVPSAWNIATVGMEPSENAPNLFVGQQEVKFVRSSDTGEQLVNIVGYDDNVWVDANQNGQVDAGEKGAFLIQNSWGSKFGNEGFIWVSYDAFLKKSQVTGYNPTGRKSFASADEVYFISAKAGYSPSLLAEFSVTAPDRSNLCLGIKNWEGNGSALCKQGGHHALGTNLSPIGTFVFDLTDVMERSKKTDYTLTLTSEHSSHPPVLLNFAIKDILSLATVTSNNPKIKRKGKMTITYNMQSESDAEPGGNTPKPRRLASVPTASAVVSATTGVVPISVSFDASTSSPSESSAKILSYKWDFGDETKGIGSQIHHTFTTQGEFPVVLTVKDSTGMVASKTYTVSTYTPPKASLSVSSQSGYWPLTVTFDGAESTTGGTIVEYDWKFCNGDEGEGVQTGYTFIGAGSCEVTLTVTDNHNLRSTASTVIELVDPPTYLPGEIFVTAVTQGNSIRLNWTSTINNIQGFHITRATMMGQIFKFDALPDVDSTVHALTDSVPPGTYQYYIWAFNPEAHSSSGVAETQEITVR
jgi:hypothetical protein